MTRAKAPEAEAPAEPDTEPDTPVEGDEPEAAPEVEPEAPVEDAPKDEVSDVHPDANLSTPANAERELEAAVGRGDDATAKAAKAALAGFERASKTATGKQTR